MQLSFFSFCKSTHVLRYIYSFEWCKDSSSRHHCWSQLLTSFLHLLTFFLFQMLVELVETASSCSQRVASQTWNRNLNPVLVFLNMAYFRAPFTARLHCHQSSSFSVHWWPRLFSHFFRPFCAIALPLFCCQEFSYFCPLSSPGHFEKIGSDPLRWITGYYCKRRCCAAWGFTLCPLLCPRSPHPARTARWPVKLSIWESHRRSFQPASLSTSGSCKVQQG